MSHYAGMDWSGTPFVPESDVTVDLYVPTGCLISDEEHADRFGRELRRKFGRRDDFELRGRKLTEREHLAVISYVLEHGVVVSMLLNKRQLTERHGMAIFDKPAKLAPATALIILDRLLQHGPLQKFITDEGDIAADRYKAFRTDAHAIRRKYYPEARTLDTKPLPSHKSILVQLADVVAYCLQRQAREGFALADVRKVKKELTQAEKNTIWWGNGDDLRSYLLP